METSTKGFLCIGLGLLALFGLVAGGIYWQPPSTMAFTPTPTNSDVVARLHDSNYKVTAIRALATQRCFILFDDAGSDKGARPLDITEEVYSHKQLADMAGPKIAHFCDGHVPTLALHSTQREKRQASNAPAIDVNKVAKLWNHQRTNECMQSTVIDCGASTSGQGPAVYTCTTGPGQLFVSSSMLVSCGSI